MNKLNQIYAQWMKWVKFPAVVVASEHRMDMIVCERLCTYAYWAQRICCACSLRRSGDFISLTLTVSCGIEETEAAMEQRRPVVRIVAVRRMDDGRETRDEGLVWFTYRMAEFMMFISYMILTLNLVIITYYYAYILQFLYGGFY